MTSRPADQQTNWLNNFTPSVSRWIKTFQSLMRMQGPFAWEIRLVSPVSRFAPSALYSYFRTTKVVTTFWVSSLYAVQLFFDSTVEGVESQGTNIPIKYKSRLSWSKGGWVFITYRRSCDRVLVLPVRSLVQETLVLQEQGVLRVVPLAQVLMEQVRSG